MPRFGVPDVGLMFDFFVVTCAAANPTWGVGNGVGVSGAAVPATATTGPGKRVLLQSIVALLNFTQTTPISVLKGDGSTNYLGTNSWTIGGNLNVPGHVLSCVMPDGLSFSGGTAGAFLVAYLLLP